MAKVVVSVSWAEEEVVGGVDSGKIYKRLRPKISIKSINTKEDQMRIVNEIKDELNKKRKR